MRELAAVTRAEGRLFLREPGAWVLGVLLPTAILLVLGAIPALREPSEEFGGVSFLHVYTPSLVVVTLAMLGLNQLPMRLATYRERGVLRRMSTTPARPSWLLTAQLVINVLATTASVVLLVLVAWAVFGIDPPRQPVGFVLVAVLGMVALFAVGLMIAAVSSSARVATALTVPVFLVVMFFGGVYLPRVMLPDVVVEIGRFTPPSVQLLLDTWMGTAPAWNTLDGLLPPAIMAGVALLAGSAAARVFRWE